MNGLAWKELYTAFSKFAYLARRHHFYDGWVSEMEYSIFEMCPFRKPTGLPTRKEQENETSDD
jgi:hypothetical protein